MFSENTTQQAIFQKQKSVRQEIILSHHSKQNHVRAVPQKRLTTLLVFGETRFGWSSNRNIVPRGAHNSMQNTKLTLKEKIKSKCVALRRILEVEDCHGEKEISTTFAENKQYCSPNFRNFIANLNDSCTAYYFKSRWRYSSNIFRSEAILTSRIGFPGYSKLLCCVHSCLT